MLLEVSMVVVWVSAFRERKLPIGGWLILRHPNRDSCPEPLFFDLTNEVFLLTFPSIPACLCVSLPVCLSAADPSVYASISICRCFFAPVFLVHSLAVWVTLALQNMPPKARAPEARMVFGWDQVSGVKFCTCSGPSRCLPTVCIPSCCLFFT